MCMRFSCNVIPAGKVEALPLGFPACCVFIAWDQRACAGESYFRNYRLGGVS